MEDSGIQTPLEKRVDSKFSEARAHLATKADLAETKTDIIKWVFGFFVALSLMVIGLYFK